MSRQNYYARRRQRQRRAIEGDLVASLVQRERQVQPRLGTRKLYHILKPELEEAGIELGRDRMFEELRKRELLLEPIAAEYPITTQSYHNLPVFENRIKELDLNAPNQVWVSDLTYLRTEEGFLYLSLITDRYSRKIVGWHVGDSLESEGCLRALNRALAELPEDSKLIHHSDRGCQYCCHQYVSRLQEHGLGISMTQSNHCAENALAERVNGILKGEYGLGREQRTKEQAKRMVEQAVHLYNRRRPHSALNFRVPEEVHSLSC